MKKLSIGLVLGLLLLGNMAFTSPSATAELPPEGSGQVRNKPSSYINDISVPFDVLVYVESEFPGHAIIEAKKTMREKKEAFQLKISRGMENEKDKYLFYSKDWKLLGKEELLPAPVVEQKTQEPSENRVPERAAPAPQPTTPRPADNTGPSRDSGDEGGRGGQEPPPPAPEPTPPPAPEPEPTPDSNQAED